MRIRLEFEPHESMPPAIFSQVAKAVGHAVEQYGLTAAIEMDRRAELEAYQRYWQWQRQQLADAEVK